jgi:Putative prokaryotic signal transducing protein
MGPSAWSRCVVSMDELVVVKVVGTEPEAELLGSLLRSAGIDCASRQTNLGAGAAEGMPGGGPYELSVRPQDLDDARDILRERSEKGGP